MSSGVSPRASIPKSERPVCHFFCYDAVGPHLSIVPDPSQQAVGNARGATRAARDLLRALFIDGHVENKIGRAHV